MPKKINKINSSRRSFLAGSATVAGAAAAASVMPISIASANHTDKGARGLPSWTAWKKRSALIIHSDKGMETHRAAIGNSVITPLRHVYIRNNMPTMSDAQIGNRNKWKLKVEGVKNPKTYTLAQLKQLAQKTEATILQCSGNGRGFFAHKVRGSQWETGAAACLIWTGCPVSAIVKDCGGLASGVKFLTATGADMPKQLNPKKALVERSIPAKARKDAFVAWEVNGVNIPNSHGGPLRMVTPGYFGINNVKHVGKLAFTAKESSVKYMKSSYRISPIGKKGSQYPSCWEMSVKSWIVSPLKSAKSGNVVVSGVAMGGTKKVSNITRALGSWRRL